MISFLTSFLLGGFCTVMVLYLIFFKKLKKLIKFKRDLDKIDSMFEITSKGVDKVD